MRRILLYIVLYLLGRTLWRRAMRYLNLDPYDPKHRPHAHSDSGVERVVRCAECGIYVPAVEIQHAHGKSFCTMAHARRYAQTTAGRKR